MSTEQRVVRPYVGLDPFATIFDQFRLRVGNELIEPARSTHLTSDEFLVTKVAVEFAPTEDHWIAARTDLTAQTELMGFSAHDLELVVIASTSFLKMSNVLERCRLDHIDQLPRMFPLTTPSRPKALQAIHHGSTVDVLLCLAKDAPVEPLRPHRFGTWIARAEFRLTTDFDAIGFRPLPLTAEKRDEMKLPPGTVRYIDVPGSPLDDVRADDAVELWVDADLLAQLSLSSKTPESRAFQMQLFIDAVAAVVVDARARLGSEASIEDLEETFLGRMLVALAGSGGSADQLLSLMLSSQGAFMAYVEVRAGLRKELFKMLGEDDS